MHKELLDKAFNIAKNPKYDGYQRGLASMVYNVFNKSLLVKKKSLKNMKKEKYTHLLKIIFWMLI